MFIYDKKAMWGNKEIAASFAPKAKPFTKRTNKKNELIIS